MNTQKSTDFDKALLEEFARMSDNSMRDGQQSLDANRIPGVLSASVLPAYQRLSEALNALATEENMSFEMPAYEFWGGGEFGQPAAFLGENPFATLRAMHALAPDVPIKALYRGRQGYGFEPIHDDTQHAAIAASFTNGVNTLRIFDMSNDWNNFQKAVSIALEERYESDAKNQQIIGCVCYTKPTDDGEMAWTPEDMAELALKFAESGVSIVEIKDYAGNLQSSADAEQWMGEHSDNVNAAHVVETIRNALDTGGYEHIPLHLHSHGQKPEALSEAMDAGAAVVDVGIGKLSGHYQDEGQDVTNTLAFTNIRDLLAIRMQQRGFDMDDHKDHPVVQALADIEHFIEQATSPVIEKRRERMNVLAKIPEDELTHHCMAGGAITALYSLIEKQWQNPSMAKMIGGEVGVGTIQMLQETGLLPDGINSPEEINADTHFLMALKLCERLWEDAGAFATVTPGAKICAEQAASASVQMMMGQPVKYTQDYKDVIAGRYGFNKGVDKGIGDQVLHAQVLGGEEQQRFAKPEGDGLDIASRHLEAIAGEHNIHFGQNNVPDRDEALLLVALTSKNNKPAIAKSLLHYLNTGERSGSIEPSRTLLDSAGSSETIESVGRIIDKLGLENTISLYENFSTYQPFVKESALKRSGALLANQQLGEGDAKSYKTIERYLAGESADYIATLQEDIDNQDITALKSIVSYPDARKVDLMALYQEAITNTQPETNITGGLAVQKEGVVSVKALSEQPEMPL